MSNVINLKSKALADPVRPGLPAELMMAAHHLQKGAMEQLLESGVYQGLSVAYADYISRLAARDYAPGELAEALGISKQQCSKAIRELETQRLIERRPNPVDSRSSLLSLSPRGWQLSRDGARAIDIMLLRIEQSIGTERVQALTGVLEALCQGLGLRIFGADDVAAPRRLNLLLPVLGGYTRDRLSADIVEQGFDRLGAGASHVFGLIGAERAQIRWIASVLGVSRQAVAQAAAELDRLGYVARQADPADARQLLLYLTPRGKDLVAAGQHSAQAIEDSFRTVLDTEQFRILEQAMSVWHSAVAPSYDPAWILRSKVQTLADELLADLGPAGARALAQHLITLTRGTL